MPPPLSLLATAGIAEERLVAVLAQLVVILTAARVAAAVARRVGQPAVVGEIMAGLVLGPSVLGHVGGPVHAAWSALFHPTTAALATVPDVFAVLSQLGLILLLFLIGLEFDFGHLRATGGASLSISFAGVVAPFTLGAGVALAMYPHLDPATVRGRLGFALFMGTAMSITAIPILGRIMVELNIARTRLGAVTIAAAAADDAVGWILLATVSTLVTAGFQWRSTAAMVVGTAAFAAAMVWVVGPALRRLARRAVGPAETLSVDALAAVLVALFGCAIATSRLGIFAIFGAFLLGAVMSPEAPFRRAAAAALRDFVTAFFLPIFFTYTGLRTDVGTLGTPALWGFAAAVTGAAVAGKFGGCAAAARWAGLPARESVLVGVMMNTRALMELIVANAGRDLGVIPPAVFCMLVLMAVATTVMTVPLLLVLVRGTDLAALVAASDFRRRRSTSVR